MSVESVNQGGRKDGAPRGFCGCNRLGHGFRRNWAGDISDGLRGMVFLFPVFYAIVEVGFWVSS